MRARSSLIMLIFSISVLFLLALFFAISGTTLKGTINTRGNLNFSSGIFFDFENVDNSEDYYVGKLKCYPNNDETETPVAFDNIEIEQNSTFKIATPEITPLSNTTPFYARARIVIDYYTGDGVNVPYTKKTAAELGTTDSEILSELISQNLVFNSNWLLANDSYYYYSISSSSAVSQSNLKLINSSSGTVEVISGNTLTFGSWDNLIGGPHGISKCEFKLELDVVEESALVWDPEPYFWNLYTLKNSDASETISLSTSLVANTTYTLVENATGKGYKFTYAENNGANEITVTAPYNNPTNLNIVGNFKWNDTTFTTTSIKNSAFSNCTGLTSITIPSSVTSIGDSAFQGCTGLQYTDGDLIYIKTTTNNHFALLDTTSTSITTATIDLNCKFILNSAFSYCTSLTSITIPSSVISIGDSAFRNCSSLTGITIPSSVTSIGNMAFQSCTGLTSITIPSSVTSIGSYAFRSCSSLTGSLTIPSGVTSIGNSVFYGCSSLTGITLPSGVTSIGTNAFYGCSSLTEITLPDSIVSIGSGAFYNSSLTGITIPSRVSSIGNGAFSGCSSFDSFTVDSGNTTYSTLDNGNLLMNGTEIIAFAPYGITNYTTIPTDGSVTSIKSYAFYYCSSLTGITIPSRVSSIGSYAFRDCTNLATVYIDSSNIAGLSNNNSDLLTNATTVYVKAGLTAGTYITSNYTINATNVSINGGTYTRYLKNAS